VVLPPEGVLYIFPARAHVRTRLFSGAFGDFSATKAFFFSMPKNGPTMAKNGQNGQNCPKIGQQNRGVPQEIPTNPKNIGKMAKNAPTVQKMHQQE